MHASKTSGNGIRYSHGSPEIGGFSWHHEIGRHHSDDRVSVAAQLNRFSEHTVIAAEVSLPKAVAQYDNRLATEPILFVSDHASDGSLRTQSLEQIRVDERGLHLERFGFAEVI